MVEKNHKVKVIYDTQKCYRIQISVPTKYDRNITICLHAIFGRFSITRAELEVTETVEPAKFKLSPV